MALLCHARSQSIRPKSKSRDSLRDDRRGRPPETAPLPPMLDFVGKVPKLIGGREMWNGGFVRVAECPLGSVAIQKGIPKRPDRHIGKRPCIDAAWLRGTPGRCRQIEIEERDIAISVDGQVVERQVAMADAPIECRGTRLHLTGEPFAELLNEGTVGVAWIE